VLIDMMTYIIERSQQFTTALAQHLNLTFIALGISVVLGPALGIISTRISWVKKSALTIGNLGRTIPSLAILALALPLLGIGTPPTVLALVFIGTLPILVNTIVGIEQVDPNIKEAARGIDKLLQSPAGVGLAAALGLGLIKVFNSSFGAKAKGSYTSGRYENPDFNDASARIEEMKRKPYLKVAYAKSSPLVGRSVGAAARRLFIGVPLTYMGSGVLQEHRKINPYEPESRVKGFTRRNPDVVSGLLVADAMLALRGKGTHGVIRKFASADLATLGEDLLKQADAQDFFSNVVIMPLAMGPAGLPGRMVGGLFDQALVDAGKKLLARRKERVSK